MSHAAFHDDGIPLKAIRRSVWWTFVGVLVASLAVCFVALIVPSQQNRRIGNKLSSLGGFAYSFGDTAWLPNFVRGPGLFITSIRVDNHRGPDGSDDPPKLMSATEMTELLSDMKQLTSLQTLKLQGTPVTDTGVGYLAGLTKLWDLDLAATHVTDAGLVHLNGMPSLALLNLGKTRITDGGLSQLKRIRKLAVLQLESTEVTDAGLVQLTGIASVWHLDLSNTRITDGGLISLTTMPGLASLNLDATQVTDEGLEHLKRIVSLKHLTLTGTQTSEVGRAGLRQVLWGCTVEPSP